MATRHAPAKLRPLSTEGQELARSSAVSNERRKQRRRIQAVSLDAPLPGTDGLTLGDTATPDNLCYIPYRMEAV